jgi:hypothetical protein
MRCRQKLGVLLLVLLLAATTAWVALGSPRPHFSVNAPATIINAPTASATEFAQAALAAERGGKFPTAVTINGEVAFVTTLGRARARICIQSSCALISGRTITTASGQ